jgi:hypothetical protein
MAGTVPRRTLTHAASNFPEDDHAGPKEVDCLAKVVEREHLPQRGIVKRDEGRDAASRPIENPHRPAL